MVSVSMTMYTPNDFYDECPRNCEDLMPSEFMRCAKLASEEKFQEGADVLCKSYENYKKSNNIPGILYYPRVNIPLFNTKDVCDFLETRFHKNKACILKNESILDPHYQLKDYIYVCILQDLWSDYFVPMEDPRCYSEYNVDQDQC